MGVMNGLPCLRELAGQEQSCDTQGRVRLLYDRFAERMDKFMPWWGLMRSELNKGPLRHESWEY